jgi:2'-5' RNA ligase
MRDADPRSDVAETPFKRLFFALSCSDAQRRAIAAWRSGLGLRSGRPVPADNFHVTLMFLGTVDTAQVANLCTAASNVRVPGGALNLILDRLEVWRKAGVLVLTAEQPPPELLRLAYALEQAMLPYTSVDRPKEYRPHLTLMRDYRGDVPETVAPEFFLRADRFALFESHKGRYRELAAWPL